MNAIKSFEALNRYDKITINYMVYEKNDDGLLLSCTVCIENKCFDTNISVDFTELNHLMGAIASENRSELYDLISNDLLGSNDFISELNLLDKFGCGLVLEDLNLMEEELSTSIAA